MEKTPDQSTNQKKKFKKIKGKKKKVSPVSVTPVCIKTGHCKEAQPYSMRNNTNLSIYNTALLGF